MKKKSNFVILCNTMSQLKCNTMFDFVKLIDKLKIRSKYCKTIT